MSAPLTGNFQDHYAVLGVEPKSDSETIQRAYAKLAQKYHPNNASTGDAEMFQNVNAAYETLSDPELRGMFDKVKGIGQEEGVRSSAVSNSLTLLGAKLAAVRLSFACSMIDG